MIPLKFTGANEKVADFMEWLIENLNEKEKDMLYLYQNYVTAYLTKAEIENGKNPSVYWRKQLAKVEELIKKYGAPLLGLESDDT